MTSPAVVLGRIYFQRCLRPLITTIATTAAVIVVFGLKRGFTIENVSEWELGAMTFLPLLSPSVVSKAKADGSLRFVAGLPVSGEEHALSWLFLSAALALPLFVTALVALASHNLGVGGGQMLVLALSLAAAVASLSYVTVGLQLSRRPGEAAGVLLGVFAVVIICMQGIAALFESMHLEPVELLASSYSSSIAGVALWLVILLAVRWSWLRIADVSTSYVGEPAQL